MALTGALAGLLFLAAPLVSPLAMAEDAEPDIPRTDRWHEPHVTLLDVDFIHTGFQARWEYFHCACGDILVRLEQSAPDGVVTGELLLVGGQALAARGLVSLTPDLEPMLQPPSVMMHLAFTLLEYTAPKGPGSVTERTNLTAGHGSRDLEIDSGLATGTFRAPWTVTGEAWPSGEGQRRFELRFEFANPTPEDPDGTSAFRFSGGQDYRRDDFPLAPETPLEGWKLQWVSDGEVQAREAPSGLTLEGLRNGQGRPET
ncbi:MAG: hypothetical protein V2I57_05100 [Xanthomonadales bacterium]|nr:hypothetical protein [Xanthomonadales bacterium]